MKDLNILIPTYNDEKSISKLLSEINIEGENIEKLSVDPEQHFTQPPPRYTEASLVKKWKTWE